MNVKIVVNPPDFEDLFATQASARIPFSFRGQVVAIFVLAPEAAAIPAIFDIAEQLNAQLVGIQSSRRTGQCSGRVIGIADDVAAVADPVSSHDGGVPVGGPAFVHDLGLTLRGEVVGFVADDRQHIHAARASAEHAPAETP